MGGGETHVEQATGAWGVDVLDHGYLRLVESWGSDERIIEAARMSTGKGFLGWGPTKTGRDVDCQNCQATGEVHWVEAGRHGARRSGTCPVCEGRKVVPETTPGDERLLKYLWDHKHHTPFEMAGVTIDVKAPIFVFREWHRHRVPFSYNEMSARYTPLPDENYVPTVDRLLAKGGANKQASSTGAELTFAQAVEVREALKDMYRGQQIAYESFLRLGVPKELARIHLPVGRYSRMRASANLRGWLAFLTLREAPAAQWEIRQYAIAIHCLLDRLFPRTIQLFEQGLNFDFTRGP